MAEGFVLKIDENLIKNVNDFDKAVKKFGQSCVTMTGRINTAIGNLNIDRVEQLVSKLNEAKSKASGLKLEVGLSNKNAVTTDVDAINRLTEALNKLSEARNKGKKDGSKNDYKEQSEGVKAFDKAMKMSENTITQRAKKILELSNVMKKYHEDLSYVQRKEGKNKISDLNDKNKEAQQWAALSKNLKEYDRVMKMSEATIASRNNKIQNLTNLLKQLNSGEKALYDTEIKTAQAERDRLSSINAQEQANKSRIADLARYNKAMQMSEVTENARLRKMEELQRALDGLQGKEQKYATEVAEARRKLNELETRKQGDQKEREKAQTLKEYDRVMKMSESTVEARAKKMEALDAVLKKLQVDEQQYAREIEAVQKAMERVRPKTPQELVDESKEAKTINQRLAAIKKLEEAKRHLDTTDKNYIKNSSMLTKEINRQKRELNKLGVECNNCARQQKGLINMTNQLKSRLVALFSIDTAVRFIKKMVDIRAEFELQQKSLGILLRNKTEANKLWNQTVDLAVKSPFRVKQLITFTKQLAAYRIESDQLFETTKRLADISSGLGVDMQRLILAYGQVRAAGFLRGTELRQFTEAGVPLLEDLAEHYTKLYGKVVTTGDVFEMISKRLVSFKDVDAVMRKMTDAGGTFYNMQYEQAKTVRGMISNLSDTFDLMFNEIGRMKQGTIVGVIQRVKELANNWERVGRTLKNVVGVFVLFKVLVTTSTILMNGLNVATGLFASMLKGIRVILQAIAAHPIVLVLTVVVSLLSQVLIRVNKLKNEQRELNETLAAATNEIGEIVFKIKSYEDAAEDMTEQIEEEVGKLERLANEEYNIDLNIKANVEEEIERIKKENEESDGIELEITPVVRSYILKDEIKKAAQEILDIQAFETAFASEAENSGSLLQIFDKNMFSEYRRLQDAEQEFLTEIEAHVFRYRDIIESDLNVTEELSDVLVEIGRGRIAGEKDYEYLERMQLLYKKLISEYVTYDFDDFGNKVAFFNTKILEFIPNLAEISRLLNTVDYGAKEAKTELEEVLEKVGAAIPSTAEGKVKWFKAILKNLEQQGYFTALAVENVKKQLEGIYDINFDEKEAEKKIRPLAKWQERFNKLLSKNPVAGIAEITNPDDNQAKMIEQVNAQYKSQLDIIEKINYAKEHGINDGAYAEYDLEKEEDTLEHLKKLREFFSEHDKDKGNGAKKDWWTERVNLLKQLHEEYKKLNKTLSDSRSVSLAIEKYQDALDEAFAGTKLDWRDVDFTNEDAILEQIKGVFENPKLTKAQRVSVGKVYADLKGDAEINLKKESDDNFKKQIEGYFQNYELFKELDEMGFSKDFAKRVFDVDVTSLESLRKLLTDLQYQFIGTDMEKWYDEQVIKIEEMENQANMDKLKKYSEYLLKEQQEGIKVRLETYRKLREIDKLQQGKNPYSQAEYDNIVENISREEADSIAKQRWDEFASSPLFVQMFDDMESLSDEVLKSMLAQLTNIKEEIGAANLPASELKEIFSKMGKIEEELYKRNPFARNEKSMTSYIKSLIEVKQLNKELIVHQEKLNQLNKEINDVQENYAASENVLATLEDNTEEYRKQKEYSDELLSLATRLVKERDAEKDEIERILYLIGRMGEKTKDIEKMVRDFSKYMKELIGSVAELLESTGLITDEMSDWVELGKNMGENVVGIASGLARGLAGDFSGWIQLASSSIKMISNIFNASNLNDEHAFERQGRMLSELNKKYDNLNKAIDDAWNTRDIIRYNVELEKTQREAIKAQRAIVNVLGNKKGANDIGTSEWEEYQNALHELEQMEEKFIDTQEEIFGKLTNGIIDDVLSASEAMVDSWYDSFDEIGDGFKGLEDNFDEMLLNMLKRQAALDIAGVFTDKWREMLKAMSEDGLTTSEIQGWAEMVKNDFPMLNEMLNGYFSAVDGILTGAGDGLTGLQKGIQEMTESTGQELAAYLNSIKFIVTDSNVQLKTLVSAMAQGSGNQVENPMVEQLRIIARQTTQINNMLDGLTAPHPSGSRGFKVII